MGWRAAGNESQDYFYGRVSNFGGEGETKGGGERKLEISLPKGGNIGRYDSRR